MQTITYYCTLRKTDGWNTFKRKQLGNNAPTKISWENGKISVLKFLRHLLLDIYKKVQLKFSFILEMAIYW